MKTGLFPDPVYLEKVLGPNFLAFVGLNKNKEIWTKKLFQDRRGPEKGLFFPWFAHTGSFKEQQKQRVRGVRVFLQK